MTYGRETDKRKVWELDHMKFIPLCDDQETFCNDHVCNDHVCASFCVMTKQSFCVFSFFLASFLGVEFLGQVRSPCLTSRVCFLLFLCCVGAMSSVLRPYPDPAQGSCLEGLTRVLVIEHRLSLC